jgi:methionine-rich copper-binding protein CopC
MSPRRSIPRRRAAVVAVLALLILAAVAGAARAHPTVVEMAPEDGARVVDPVVEARIRFSEPVTPVEVAVVGPDGQPLSVGPPELIDGVVVRQTVRPPRRRGVHTVSYQVLAVDDHLARGTATYRYTGPVEEPDDEPAGGPEVGDEPTVREPPAADPPQRENAIRSLWSMWPLALVLVLAALVGAAPIRTVRAITDADGG